MFKKKKNSVQYGLDPNHRPVRVVDGKATGLLSVFKDVDAKYVTIGEPVGEDSVAVQSDITGSPIVSRSGFRDATISGIDSVYIKARVAHSAITSTSVQHAQVTRSTVKVSDIAHTNMDNSVLYYSTALYSSVGGSDVRDAMLVDCDVWDSSVHNVDITHVEIRNADISEPIHIVQIPAMGKEGVAVLFYRLKDGTDFLRVGCWEGTLDTLMAEVHRRVEVDPSRAPFQEDYEALHTLLTSIKARW